MTTHVLHCRCCLPWIHRKMVSAIVPSFSPRLLTTCGRFLTSDQQPQIDDDDVSIEHDEQMRTPDYQPGDNGKIRVCENPRFQSGNMLGPIEVFKQIDCLTALEGCSSTNCKKKTWLLDSLYKWSGWEKNMLQMTQFFLGRVTHFFLGHLWSITNWNGCNFMGNWSLAAKQVSN